MKIFFIGAGPGAPDLLTLRGRDRIAACPVCLYAGSLVPREIVAYAPAGARLVNTAGLTLEQIIGEFETAAAKGLDVARVHSGDPSIFSAIGEQIVALKARNISYEIIPGVPAFAACAASLGKELTVPGLSQSVVLTRFGKRGSKMPPAETLEQHAQSGATLAIHLSVRDIDAIVDVLGPYYGEDCPAAVVYRSTCQDEKMIEGTLKDIARQTQLAQITRSALIFVGRALTEMTPEQRSNLYLKSDD